MKSTVDEQDMSEFNAGIAKLMRLDKIKRGLIVANMNRNYDLMYRCLTAYFKELISVMNDEDDKIQKERFDEVRKSYNEYIAAIKSGKKSISQSVVNNLEDWEIELRNIDQKYGLEMPKKSDPRFAMASGGRKY